MVPYVRSQNLKMRFKPPPALMPETVHFLSGQSSFLPPSVVVYILLLRIMYIFLDFTHPVIFPFLIVQKKMKANSI